MYRSPTGKAIANWLNVGYEHTRTRFVPVNFWCILPMLIFWVVCGEWTCQHSNVLFGSETLSRCVFLRCWTSSYMTSKYPFLLLKFRFCRKTLMLQHHWANCAIASSVCSFNRETVPKLLVESWILTYQLYGTLFFEISGLYWWLLFGLTSVDWRCSIVVDGLCFTLKIYMAKAPFLIPKAF